jgi:chaperonin GroES|tara:strand:+ start:34 stop:324 length:291 start_codon:yes stop_codon:yes gene_type:complete
MKLTAVFNSIIVKPQTQEETTYGNIVVPDLGKEKHLTGTIVSVGPGYHCATGEFVASTLKVGQKVILPQMGPTKIEFEGEEYYGTLENQVIAIIND